MPLSATSNECTGILPVRSEPQARCLCHYKPRRQPFRRRQIHLESFQIAIVHADERRGNFQRAFQFFLVVNFHQNGQSGFNGERMKFCQLLVRQNGDDEQDGVRAPFDGFENLAFINDEILAQQRQFHGGADLAEIIERALEKFFVGQNGQAACARRFVFFGDADGIKVLANDAGGRRRFFHFGNQWQRDVSPARARDCVFFDARAKKSRRSPCSSIASRKSPAAMRRAGSCATSRFFCSTISSRMFTLIT